MRGNPAVDIDEMESECWSLADLLNEPEYEIYIRIDSTQPLPNPRLVFGEDWIEPADESYDAVCSNCQMYLEIIGASGIFAEQVVESHGWLRMLDKWICDECSEIKY